MTTDRINPDTGEVLAATASPSMSPSIDALAAAFVKAQAAMRAVPKTKTARVESQRGKYSYDYADLAACLDAVRGPLADHGLALLQPVSGHGDAVTVTTMLLHASGQWVREALTLRPAQPTPQGIGSAITYGRRYTLALIGLTTEEDDDAAEASREGEGVRHGPTEAKSPAETRGNGAPAADAPRGDVTENQVKAIRAIAAKLGLEPHAAAGSVLRRDVPHLTGLSRRDASTVIESLQREETTREGAR